jgi:hypothetical protein
MSIFTPFTTGFVSADYNRSNYGELQDVDRDVINLFLSGFHDLGIEPRSIHGICACVGAGPTPLDAMLASIFLGDGSRIKSLDISDSNLIDTAFRVGNGTHVYESEDMRGRKVKIDTIQPWIKFEEEILEQGTKIFSNSAPFQQTLKRYQRMGESVYGDINRLPAEVFSLGTSFYCAESATPFQNQMEYMWTKFFHSLMEGAPFVIASVVESDGYRAGEFTKFPATHLQEPDYHDILSRMPITYKLSITSHTFRPGHGGVAVIVGRKKSSLDAE